ncbi:hypothetical protein B0F90DRAFT_1695698 [Multifurca ochricompacta]|uniref:DUF202 domain-containing protein n=1 Tax=Multifurca ochricompacta TaxID=376703 RepID=A0AAD4QRG6_9AGAM|nr:hypothetical protein B0F90DRAFT_1695698 [Multifurca ochricompacta]
MQTSIENYGSTARDYCMLERNFLSHARLGLLLMLLASSALLNARLPGPENPGEHEKQQNHGLDIPLASIEVAAALIVIGTGCWEYESGIRDMRARRAFLVSTEPHFIIMLVIAAVVFTICVVLLVHDQEIGV